MCKKADFEKFQRVVNSCNSLEQFPALYNYGRNLYSRYGENPFIQALSLFAWEFSDLRLQYITKTIEWKRDKLMHQIKVVDI